MKTKMRLLILLGLLAGLGGLVYASTLSDLFFSVIQREDSSHGICVPFIAGYLIWLKLAKIKETKAEFAPALGMMLAAPGMLLFFFSSLFLLSSRGRRAHYRAVRQGRF